MRSTLLLCSLLAACAEANPGPTVVIVPYHSDGMVPEWDGVDIRTVERGAAAWDDLGFIYLSKDVDDVPYEGEMDLCPYDWAQQGLTECAIPVGVTQEAFLVERYGAVGLANRSDDTIIIDSRYHGNDLQVIVAHEFGHILLNTPRHLPDGQHGIMEKYLSWHVRPTSDDYRLVCEATGICI